MFPSAAEMTADMDEIIADLPGTLVWGSQSVSCTGGDVSKSAMVEMTGAAIENGVMVCAVMSDFTGSVYPPVNEKVAWNGVAQRVISIIKGADGVSVTLMLDRLSA